MRGGADGYNAESGENRAPSEKLDRAEAQAALEREIAEELARPLAQIARVRPADVLAARADACFLTPPRTGGKGARMAAAKALDCELLHGTMVGLQADPRVPKARDATQSNVTAQSVTWRL